MRRLLLILPLALPAFAWGADPLRMSIQPLFEGQEILAGYTPLRAVLENDGPAARGVITIETDGQRTVYPVDLPTGARKIVPLYENLSWGSSNVSLQTNQGRISKDVPTNGGGNDAGIQQLLLVTESPGELAAVRTMGKKGENSLMRDSYVRPGEAPDRPLAYQGVAAVLLGEGAERLSDDAVSALRDYVLMGGTVVMFGGASAPVLSDTRWGDVAPVMNGKVETVSSIEIASTQIDGPVTLVRATPREGSIVRDEANGRPTIVERPVGLGRVLFVAINPMESQATGQEIAGMLYRGLRPNEGLRGRTVLHTYGGSGATVTPMGTPANVAEDPFTAELPNFDTIAWILGGFFIAAIPVNFLLLRALKKGEWAWFTAPLLSLGFASLLFAKARDLYSAKTSTFSVGAVVAQQGVPDGWFVGETSFFIPSGGIYDLKLTGVDSIGAIAMAQDGGSPFGRTAEQSELETIDTGKDMAVPSFRANNLAFRSVDYRQRLPDVGSWFKIATRNVGDNTVEYEVRNVSQHTLTNAVVMLGDNGQEIGTLAPGAVHKGGGKFVLDNSNAPKMRVTPPPGAPPAVTFGGVEEGQNSGSLGSLSYRSQRPILTGFVSGVRPGPQIGSDITNRSSIRLLFMGGTR